MQPEYEPERRLRSERGKSELPQQSCREVLAHLVDAGKRDVTDRGDHQERSHRSSDAHAEELVPGNCLCRRCCRGDGQQSENHGGQPQQCALVDGVGISDGRRIGRVLEKKGTASIASQPPTAMVIANNGPDIPVSRRA